MYGCQLPGILNENSITQSIEMSHSHRRGLLFIKGFILSGFLMLTYNYSKFFSFIKTIHSLAQEFFMLSEFNKKIQPNNLGCFSFGKKIGWNRQKYFHFFVANSSINLL